MTYFAVEHRDSIALVTFVRPPRNLMSMSAMTELEGVLSGLATEESVNVVVITGGVPGYFIAHADLDDLIRLGRGEPVEGDPLSWSRTFALMDTMPQPVVAAINGQAGGGGCELALACTLRVASESAHFGQPEVSVGIIPGAGGTQRLPRLIGPGRAAELILSARVIVADEAERIGLVEAGASRRWLRRGGARVGDPHRRQATTRGDRRQAGDARRDEGAVGRRVAHRGPGISSSARPRRRRCPHNRPQPIATARPTTTSTST